MPLIESQAMNFRYPSARRSGAEWTIEDIDVSIEGRSSVGIVGESGSGKSTLVRVLCGLLHHQSGRVTFDGRDVADWLRTKPKELRRRNQIVFQSPRRSLDPRMTIGRSLKEPMLAIERRTPSSDELVTWLEQVGLTSDVLRRFPHQLSGGQLQRVSIARALSVGPDVLYADEPTSALDVSVRAQVLNLLMDIRTELGLTLVMVSHDLAVISRMCEHVVVMKDGRIVESGPMADVLSAPATAYTAALVGAARSVSLRT